MKFKVGDRVRLIYYNYPNNPIRRVGNVYEIAKTNPLDIYPYSLWYPNKIDYFNCKEHWLELVQPVNKSVNQLTPPFYVNCPTEEIWNKVVEKMKSMGYSLFAGQTENDRREYVWVDRDNTFMSLHSEHLCRGIFVDYHDFLGIEREDRLMPENPTITPNYTVRVVDAKFGLGTTIKNSFSKAMDELRKIPAGIKKLLDKATQAKYKLEWVNSELAPTSEGDRQLMALLHEKYEKELGQKAIEEVARRVKALKKAKKEIEED